MGRASFLHQPDIPAPYLANLLVSHKQQDMNDEFQAAYIQGLLDSVSGFGVTDHLQEPIAASIDCLIKRKWTPQQIVQRFTPFLKRRPDLNMKSLPMAFLEYLLEDCHLN